jgi:MerR family transcriptional regulator, light-induced transcriptional regulator
MTNSQTPFKNVARYSIKDLEHLSGIKAHTLRIWEQRYGIIEPQRTDTNIRYYSDDDLKYILNISLLNTNGYKISRLAELSRDQVAAEVGKLTSASQSYESDISSLIVSTIDLNEALFEQVFQQNVITIGFEKTITDVVYPFLDRIGTLWLSGSICPAQEHFITNLIRQKLIVAIDIQPKLPEPGAKSIVIYTPEQELHEISILFAAYAFKRQQQKVFYLGASVPFENVKMVVDRHKADIVLCSITATPNGSQFNSYLDSLNASFPDKKIILTGYQVQKRKAEVPDNMIVLSSLDELFSFVSK